EPLAAGPAEVLAARAELELLPGHVADVADHERAREAERGIARAGAREQRRAERVAQPERPDARADALHVAVVERIGRQAEAGLRIEPQDLARERVHALRAERADVLRLRRRAGEQRHRVDPVVEPRVVDAAD